MNFFIRYPFSRDDWFIVFHSQPRLILLQVIR
jgi:hypothetical protein